ncbi:MAG: RNA-guided endonuclease InsQ/TnpB family protein [Xenococcus sp. (in: cyanobacteria)]
MKTYKFKLYQHKRNKHLHRTINAAGNIYNHCIALHKRYYSLFGKHLNKNRLMKHLAKLRRKNEYWQLVGSQAVQDIVQRIDRAYQLFFKHHKKAVEARVADRRKGTSTKRGVRPPNFRKRIKYKSFTLKQAGYKFLDNNQLKISNKVYRYWKSREIQGKVKTVTIKRNPLGELFIFVVTDYVDNQINVMTGKSAGFDFGLKTFLTSSDDNNVDSPLFLRQSLKQLKLASRNLSRKKKLSNSREKARKNLVRVHEKVTNCRTDWFWKLAHQLTDNYDYLYFETLNLKGMQRLWGRKISDLAFSEFLKILEFVAEKKGKIVSYIDQWYPSSKTCSSCDYVLDELSLAERYWVCPCCNSKQVRDLNAAINILRVGASTLRLGDVSQLSAAISA